MVSEEKVLSRVTRRLIPFMFFLYIVSYLDRINVGFAALQLNQALKFDPTVFGLGAGIFFIGYFIFEVPSNLIMERAGARIWIARILVTWGIISSAMIPQVTRMRAIQMRAPARSMMRLLGTSKMK